MDFGVLGPVEVWNGDDPVDIGGPKARLVLAALIACRGEPVSQDRLGDAIWPQSQTAVDTLQSYVSRLRRQLGQEGRDLVERTERGYRLAPHAAVDSENFEELAEEGRRLLASADLVGAAARLGDALDLWRGVAFGELGSEELLRPEAARLDELRQSTREDLIEVQLGLGHHSTVVAEVEALADSHPLRERLWELLMVALSRSGRQGEALRTYQRARRHLGEELGIEPSARLRELEAMIVRQDQGLSASHVLSPSTPAPAKLSLPADATRFIGRSQELEETRIALGRARLVTLTGAPGVGKTRLATATARRTASESRRHVGFVDLSDATEPHEATDRIDAGMSDWQPDETTTDGDQSMLLVVDNCEHLVDACAAHLAGLLARHGDLQVLATSREALRVPGEVVLPVPPMALPQGETQADIVDVDSVRLFVERCADARPGFDLTATNADDVRRICLRLDGIPLALELAAARAATMGLREIRRGLDRRFDLLTEGYRTSPARHRTLSAALDWSYRLLGEPDRSLFDQLRYFNGDFHVLAAEVICAGESVEEESVQPLLSSLVRSSLVTMEERSGEAVYRLMPMVREFLLLQRGSGFGRGSRRGFLFHLAQWTEPRLRGTNEQMWRVLFEGPRDTARATMDLAYELHKIEDGSFLAGIVAARTTKTGRVGFVGGVREPYIERFETGFTNGVRHANAEVEPDVAYVTEGRDYYTGFFDPAAARRVATAMLAGGVDVVFHAAGIGGGQGVFEAAHEVTESSGRHRWVIGVDVDERVTRDREHLPHVLTSMRRQVPVATYAEIKTAVSEGRPKEAPPLGLANEGVGLAGDLSVPLAHEIEEATARIVAGELSTGSSGRH